MSVAFVSEQVFGWLLLVGLLAFVGHLLWVPFRDSRDGRPWLVHGVRTAALVVGCALVMPILVDFVFMRGQITLSVVSALLFRP